MVLVPSMSSFVDGESINMDCPFIVELFLRIRLVNTVEPKIKVSLHGPPSSFLQVMSVLSRMIDYKSLLS